MVHSNIEILAILRYYFQLGPKFDEIGHRICEVEETETISKCFAQNWFISKSKTGLSNLNVLNCPLKWNPKVNSH